MLDAGPLTPSDGVSAAQGTGRVPRVLLIDDEAEVVDALKTRLQLACFEWMVVSTIKEAHRLLRTRDVDVALLDVALPDGCGLELMRELESRAVPVLVLTAARDRDTKIASFRAGACDFVTKPFDVEELMYRVRVALRRRVGAAPVALRGPCGIRLVAEGQKVSVDGTPVPLSRIQFLVFRELLERRGEVVSANDLSRAVWGHQTFDSRNYVELQVSRLRQRLAEAGARDVIETIRGVGYAIR